MSAADERAALTRLLPTLTDPTEAVTALLFIHTRLPDPSNPAGWICGCLHLPRLGQSFHRHTAEAIVDHLKGRT